MARILIVYATRQGQTDKIARHLAADIRMHGDTVDLADTDLDGAFPADRADAIVVAAPIHAGGYPRSLRRWVKAHREALERVPSVFCSVGLAVASRTSDGRAQSLEVVERFVRQTGWRPRQIELIAGALSYSKYNWLIRLIMRRIAAHEGGDVDTSHDYEYTDWNALDRFAADFVSRLMLPSREPAAAAG
jgi:menaquinone-dependent protoporphyrinogen oxidase